MENNRKEDAEKIVKEMEKITELSKLEELIKDNKITFEHKEKKYRVRLLNLREKEELQTLRRRKFGELIQDKNILLEKDLIEQYKKRDLNIDDISEEIKKLKAEDISLQLNLGKLISTNASDVLLKNDEEKIKEIRIKIQVLSTQKNLLLSFSLENQIEEYNAKVITYLSLDECVEGRWQRMFNTMEAFDTYEESEVIDTAAVYSMVLQNL